MGYVAPDRYALDYFASSDVWSLAEDPPSPNEARLPGNVVVGDWDQTCLGDDDPDTGAFCSTEATSTVDIVGYAGGRVQFPDEIVLIDPELHISGEFVYYGGADTSYRTWSMRITDDSFNVLDTLEFTEATAAFSRTITLADDDYLTEWINFTARVGPDPGVIAGADGYYGLTLSEFYLTTVVPPVVAQSMGTARATFQRGR